MIFIIFNYLLKIYLSYFLLKNHNMLRKIKKKFNLFYFYQISLYK